MRAGKLRHRIKVYSPNLSPDGCGGFNETFSLLGTIWAKVIPRDPATDERYVDRHLELVQMFTVTTRYNVGFSINTRDVFEFNGVVMRIDGESNKSERSFQRNFACEEIEGDSIEFAGMFNQAGDQNMFSQDGKKRMFSQEGV